MSSRFLPNPKPGSSTRRSRFTPPICARSARSRSSRFTSVTMSEIRGRVRHSSGRPRMCINTAPHFRLAIVLGICASQRNPLTSLTISAPAATAARATPALYVSAEITASGRCCFRRVITGIIRSNSSFSVTVGVDLEESAAGSLSPATLAPGRVDSPPTSMTSAPSRSN